MADEKPGALTIDLQPAVEFARAIDALEQAWQKVPASQRSRLTRLVWLHPGGEVVIYQAPDGPPVNEGG